MEASFEALMNSARHLRFQVCFADSRCTRDTTPVVVKAQLAIVCVTAALLACVASTAQAQRDAAEDEWAQAALDDVAMLAPPPLPSYAAPGEVRAADLAQLEREVAWAHRVLPGDVHIALRAPEGYEWFWLGAAEVPSRSWRILGAPTLCAHDCAISIPPGRVRLGLRADARRPGLAREFTVARRGVLTGHYVSRRAHVGRALGLMIGSSLLAVGAGLLISRAPGDWTELALVVGVGIYLGGHIPGAIRLLNSRPRTVLEFSPRGARAH